MRIVTSGVANGHYGHHHTQEACEQIAVRTRGKTLEQIYGEELAIDMKRRMSQAASGSNNPAFGKVYANGGKSIKGHYKGRFFRSLFEYSFMKHLESQGVSLDDVDYECFTVPYRLEERERTYHVDFYVKSQNVVYEVKPAYAVKKPTLINAAKWNAARDFFSQRGIDFKIVTENDFQKIKFDDALKDADVVWKTETFKYFQRRLQSSQL
jgi:hypothetical protein